MSFDLSALTPTVAKEGLSKRTVNRESAPNPVLDNGWLQASYERQTAYEFANVPGVWEEYDKKNRKDGTTERATKLTGDAAKVIAMLRAAADTLNIGVRIETIPGTKKGHITIKYLGTPRKKFEKTAAKRGETATASE